MLSRRSPSLAVAFRDLDRLLSSVPLSPQLGTQDKEIAKLKADLDELGKAFEFTNPRKRLAAQLAERDAEIARSPPSSTPSATPPSSTSPNGALRLPCAGPDREDGTLLRVTTGSGRRSREGSDKEWERAT